MYCGKFKNFLQREFLDRRISFGEPQIQLRQGLGATGCTNLTDKSEPEYRRRALAETV
jgi:hypothetical protein